MNSHPLAFSFRLVMAGLMLVGAGQVRGEAVPENNFPALEAQIRKTPKDTSALRAWFEKNLKPLADTDDLFTSEYLRFLGDVSRFNWEGSVTESQLRRKWGRRFDLDRMIPDQPFENGNCGWASRKLAKFDYLGQLNGGDWFRLTIVGGCGDDDYSQTVRRVVKVVSTNGRYQIANLIAP